MTTKPIQNKNTLIICGIDLTTQVRHTASISIKYFKSSFINLFSTQEFSSFFYILRKRFCLEFFFYFKN